MCAYMRQSIYVDTSVDEKQTIITSAKEALKSIEKRSKPICMSEEDFE